MSAAEIDLASGGTPADTWTAWLPDFPLLDLGACPALVIVAPHPDDETLGLGATAATLAGRGVPVQVVAVSDGDAAYPGLDANDRGRLAAVRRTELSQAAAMLGVAEPLFVGLPDGELDHHEDRTADALADILAAQPAGAWCAATWRGDGHPDHEAVGRAAAAAARNADAVFAEYPVWMWHWATPGEPAVPWQRARRPALSPAGVVAKRQAAQCFRSQFLPPPGQPAVLPAGMVQRLLAVGEVLFV
ncbi:PIG-L family deacetylase [Mycobacterium sp.]|uniref:PIG-L deacetylase family protein n=1 Tax=Mycobacterium sp. TaxID=1785 RepID=UPI002C7D7F67|nr:PIG-L family deacetylase [Mycobacterium sp.]HME47771.1 PIG-L family deacetylase [Mycobacterium sp.]